MQHTLQCRLPESRFCFGGADVEAETAGDGNALEVRVDEDAASEDGDAGSAPEGGASLPETVDVAGVVEAVVAWALGVAAGGPLGGEAFGRYGERWTRLEDVRAERCSERGGSGEEV